jgi:hypothetical protein
MRKIFACMIISMLLASSVVAADAQGQFTGSDYLKLVNRDRLQLVSVSIANVRKEGVTIKKAPVFYCQKLDSFYNTHPEHKKEAVGKVLKTLIIMEYDWAQKGVDKDTLAKEWLGDDVYKQNKHRMGR